MRKKLSFYLLALFALLLLGCSKSTDPKPDSPGPSTDEINIPIFASYPGNINITNNKIILSVGGEANLTYYIPPGKDTTITIKGTEATNRKGKLATLTMSCEATDLQGNVIPICYNNNGVVTINSLATNNSKVQWTGEACGTSGDQVIIRIKLTMQYSFPGEYVVYSNFFTLGAPNHLEVTWNTSSTVDTVIILTGEAASSRIGKPFYMIMSCNALDQWGNYAQIAYTPESGVFRGDPLLADNPKIEWIGVHAN